MTFPGAIRGRAARARKATAINTQLRAQYAALRLLGCTAKEAARLRRCRGALEYAQRKLARGLRP